MMILSLARQHFGLKKVDIQCTVREIACCFILDRICSMLTELDCPFLSHLSEAQRHCAQAGEIERRRRNNPCERYEQQRQHLGARVPHGEERTPEDRRLLLLQPQEAQRRLLRGRGRQQRPLQLQPGLRPRRGVGLRPRTEGQQVMVKQCTTVIYIVR